MFFVHFLYRIFFLLCFWMFCFLMMIIIIKLLLQYYFKVFMGCCACTVNGSDVFEWFLGRFFLLVASN